MGIIPGLHDRATILFYDEDDVLRRTIELDCTTNESHGRTAKIADHPVAKGVARTDMVRPDPTPLEIVGFFGNFPADVVLAAKRIGEVDFKHAEKVYEQLEDAFTKGWTATVKTSVKQYDSMVLHKFSAPRDAGTGNNSLTISMSFREIQIVVAQRGANIPAKPKQTSNGPQKKAGAKPPQENKAQSAAAKLLDQAKVSQKFTLTRPIQ